MGLFDKLEANIHHGGVKVQVQAPSAVPSNQVIPVTVTITADSAQTVNNVKAEVKAESREQGMMMSNGMNGMNGMNNMGFQQNNSGYQTIAQVESREPFTIGPGETKTVNVQLFVSGNTGNANPLGQMGGAIGAIASIANSFEHVNYIYRVYASADVAGVTLDPSDHQQIELLPPSAVPPTAQPTTFASGQMPQTQPPTMQAPQQVVNPMPLPPVQPPQQINPDYPPEQQNPPSQY